LGIIDLQGKTFTSMRADDIHLNDQFHFGLSSCSQISVTRPPNNENLLNQETTSRLLCVKMLQVISQITLSF